MQLIDPAPTECPDCESPDIRTQSRGTFGGRNVLWKICQHCGGQWFEPDPYPDPAPDLDAINFAGGAAYWDAADRNTCPPLPDRFARDAERAGRLADARQAWADGWQYEHDNDASRM